MGELYSGGAELRSRTRTIAMRKAFTLLELLIVIAVLGLLMGLLVPQAGKALRQARETTCRNNLRNLQVAATTRAVSSGDSGNLPFAGSYEVRDHRGNWHERRGWVSWRPRSGTTFPSWGTATPRAGLMEDAGHIGDRALFGIRHGTLFDYVSGEVKTYHCPVAARDEGFRKRIGASRGDAVHLTYVMSEFFRFEGRKGWYPRYLNWIGTNEGINIARPGQPEVTGHPEASRLVLFAEHSGVSWGQGGPAIGRNCVLHIPDNMANQAIDRAGNSTIPRLGAYHDGPVTVRGADGRAIPWGLVIFLDGHIEKVLPNVRGDGVTVRNRAWHLIRGLEPPDK